MSIIINYCALVLTLLEAIFSKIGSCQTPGDVTLMILTTIKNIMNPINHQSPAFANLFPFPSFLFRIEITETENSTIAGIIRDTNIDLLGNSKGENDEMVSRISIPAIIAASAWTISLALISSLTLDGFISKDSDFVIIRYLCFCHDFSQN